MQVYRASIVEKKRKYKIQCARRVSGIIFTRYAQNRNFEKPNNLNVFETNKTNGPKQDRQNRPRQPIPEGVKGNARVKKLILYITELVLRKVYTILSNPIYIRYRLYSYFSYHILAHWGNFRKCVNDVAEAIPLKQPLLTQWTNCLYAINLDCLKRR